MNTKAIAIYTIIMVLLIVAVILFLPKQLPGGSFTTTISSSPPQGGNTTSIQQSYTTATTTQPYVSKCILNYSSTYLLNGGFAKGTYAQWNASGTGFGTMPTNLTYSNKNAHYYGVPWSGYNGVYFATTYSGGTTPQIGNLTSDSFTVTAPYLNFKLISPQSNLIYVQILYNNTPTITTYFNTYAVPGNTNASSTFQNASITLTPLLCDKVQVRLVAKAISTTENQFNFIAATGFYLSPKPQSAPDIIVNQSINLR